MAPNRSKTHKRSQVAPASAFDGAALEKLTAQIDKNLDTSKAKNANGGKRKRGADAADVADEEEAPKAAKMHKKQSPENPPRNQGTTADNASAGSKDKKSIMLDEIMALGGDEGDLELVEGIDSDAEDGAAGKADRTEVSLDDAFKNELAKFAAGLGFENVREEDENDEEEEEEGKEDEMEVEEEEGEEEEGGEEEEEEEEEGEDDEKEKEKEAEKAAPQPKEADKKMEKPAAPADPLVFRNPKFAKLAFEPRPDWHSADVAALPPPTSADIGRLSQVISSLKAYAATLAEADARMYQNIVSSSSSHRFASTIMSSGTMSDKVSAMTLEIQETPVHNTKAFENLMTLAGKRSRGQAIAALGALVDLLGNGVVLPNDRRLRTFETQPGLLGTLQQQQQAAGPGAPLSSWKSGQALPGALTKAHLIMWHYEDWLKDAFFRMLQLLEVWSNDEIEYSRSRSLDFVFGMLKNKPEQEANLLRLLVNKLGDRERKIASRASYLLLQLLNMHPGMKPIVVRSIEEEVMLRPGQSLRAKYYAINTLNQTILSQREPAVADTLVRIYFELFLSLLKTGALGAVDMSGSDAITDGANNNGKNKKHGGKGDRGAKGGKGDKGDSKEATTSSKNVGNEKDVAEKLVSSLLTGVNRALPFATTDNSTLEEHIGTLFRITHSSNFNTSIQALMLVQQVAVTKQLAVDRFYRTLYESLLDPRLVTSSKQAMYLNLLFRSLKNDVDVRRVKAFVKRMLQISTLHQPPFVCGILFMISELETSFPDLKALLNDPEADESDEEEVYRDVVEGEDAAAAAAAAQAAEAAKKSRVVYDGRKRDPEYSNAQKTCLWELTPFFKHFHPSVAAFATNLLVRQTSLPKPDMANHTLMHFLDKFVYRNAKTAEGKQRGASIMQPVAAAATGANATALNGAAQIVAPVRAAGRVQEAASINSAAFWGKKVEDVAVEDVFFHTYFAQVGKPAQTSRAAKRAAKQKEAEPGEEGAAAGEGSDGEEDEIWEALKGSRPEIDADNDMDDVDMDDDDEDDMSGLESLLNMSDSDDDDDDISVDMGEGDDDEDGGVEFADFDEESGEDGEDGEAGLEAVDARKSSRQRKKELKALPTFASVDDYADLLAQEEDEDYQ